MVKSILTFFILLIILPLISSADSYPNSVNKWINQSNYFWKMDFSDEQKFKTKLIKYYDDVFTGELKERFNSWINEGSLESDHFSWYYKSRENTKVMNILKEKNSKNYIFHETQTECFSGDYNAPNMSDIVEKYKVINKSQSEVDAYVKSFKYPFEIEGCLIIKQKTTLYLSTDKKPLIYKIDRQIVESKLNFDSK